MRSIILTMIPPMIADVIFDSIYRDVTPTFFLLYPSSAVYILLLNENQYQKA